MPIPLNAQAVLSALRFHGADGRGIRAIDKQDWPAVLRFCDQSQLTLLLGAQCGEDLPEDVRSRIENDLDKSARKFSKLKAEFFEIAKALKGKGLEFVALKGFTHSPDFTRNPLFRAQGDIDLWLQPEVVQNANAALLELGYLPHCETENRHLPPLIRPTEWQWTGDYYDPGVPIGVDLHYRLWDDALERIEVPGIEDFWSRRIIRQFDGHAVFTLCPADALAFAALHHLLHVLRGDARLQRAWEIASFLENYKDNANFWDEWRGLHPERLRLLEVVAFRMCSDWFGNELSPSIEEEVANFPEAIKLWFQRHSQSPVENLFRPNKNELWLHLALAESLKDRAALFRRRVFPIRRLHENSSNPVGSLLWSAKRAVHHAAILPGTLAEGVRWWWMQLGLDESFLRFQFASALFDLGAFIFFVLYNLYLLDLGFKEQFLGMVSGSMTAGTLVAALPAAAFVRRFGIRTALLTSILGGAGASAARVLFPQEASLLLFAFLHGVFFCFWAVCLSPIIAGLSNEKNRSFAFSLIFATGIGTGALGGIIAGHLPSLFANHPFLFAPIASKRVSLILSSVVLALGAPAALRVRLPVMNPEERKIYPPARSVQGFLIALFVWTFATGAFNPFFNAYLAGRGHQSVQSIGSTYAISQLLQVAAVLLAPLCFRKLGEISGVALMQFTTAVALAALVTVPPGWTAIIYPIYMAFQYMSSPGMFSMLMGQVSEEERGGASALNFTVSSAAGMLASFAGGMAIDRYGYPVMIYSAAILAAFAALLFRSLIHKPAFSRTTLAIRSEISCRNRSAV